MVVTVGCLAVSALSFAAGCAHVCATLCLVIMLVGSRSFGIEWAMTAIEVDIVELPPDAVLDDDQGHKMAPLLIDDLESDVSLPSDADESKNKETLPDCGCCSRGCWAKVTSAPAGKSMLCDIERTRSKLGRENYNRYVWQLLVAMRQHTGQHGDFRLAGEKVCMRMWREALGISRNRLRRLLLRPQKHFDVVLCPTN